MKKKLTLVEPGEIESESKSENEERWIISYQLVKNPKGQGGPQVREPERRNVENDIRSTDPEVMEEELSDQEKGEIFLSQL